MENISDCGGIIFFAALTSSSQYEPAVTYGTLASSRFVADIYPGGTGSNPGLFTRMGDWVYYAATDNVNGRELWRTHVTTLETKMVKNIRPGPFSSNPHDFGVVNGKLLFSAEADPTTTGDELWVSDGTEAGTTLLKDLVPGSGDANIEGKNGRLFVHNGVAYFQVEQQLWRSDGTAAGTFLLNRNTARSGNPGGFTIYNGRVFFFVRDSVSSFGYSLWSTNGTTAGTARVKGLVTGSGVGVVVYFPSSTAVANGLLFFRGGNGPNGYELWRSDGTEAGTSMVKDILIGSNSSEPNNLVTYKNRVYFVANDGIRGNQIWSSDGTSNGTVMVQEIYNATSSGRPEPAGLTVFGDFLFFNMLRDGYGREWWTTDGTSLSNGPAFDLTPGSGSGIDEDDFNQVVGSSFYFYGSAPTVGGELWRLNVPTPIRTIELSGSLGFGSVLTGSTAQSALTIRNRGNIPLGVSSITFPEGFSGTWNGTIPGGGSHTVNVTFSPKATKTYQGIATVQSNAQSGSGSIGVSGQGVLVLPAPPRPAPRPAPTPDPRLGELAALQMRLADAGRMKNPRVRASQMRLLNAQINALNAAISGGTNTGGSASGGELAALQKQLADARKIKNPKIRARKIADINAKIAAL